MELIQLKDLRKIYTIGGVTIEALAGVSLDIGGQEFVAIMGPSGSGKSTLMHILGCLDSPTSGQYMLRGKDVSSLRSDDLAAIRNQDMGFVFQAYNLLPQMSALENVMLPLSYATKPIRDGRRKAEGLLEHVGLKDRMKNRPVEMSGGEQQRVAIARSLVNRPPLILADEPTGNLDTRTSIEIMAIFQRLNRDGISVVLVTHEPDIAQFTMRTVMFRDGRIVKDEPVASPRVAEADLAGMKAA